MYNPHEEQQIIEAPSIQFFRYLTEDDQNILKEFPPQLQAFLKVFGGKDIPLTDVTSQEIKTAIVSFDLAKNRLLAYLPEEQKTRKLDYFLELVFNKFYLKLLRAKRGSFGRLLFTSIQERIVHQSDQGKSRGPLSFLFPPEQGEGGYQK